MRKHHLWHKKAAVIMRSIHNTAAFYSYFYCALDPFIELLSAFSAPEVSLALLLEHIDEEFHF